MFNTILIGSGCLVAGGLIVKFWKRNEAGLKQGGDALIDKVAPEWCHEKLHQIYADGIAWGHDLFNDPKYVAKLLRLAVSSNFNLKDELVKWATSIDWTKNVEDQLPMDLKEAVKPMMNSIKQEEVSKNVSGNILAALPVELHEKVLPKVEETVAILAQTKQPRSTEDLIKESIARQEALRNHK